MSHNTGPILSVTRTKDQARATYDRRSCWYDLASGIWEKRHRETALRMLDPGDGDIVLEIGFGTGHGIVALAEAVGVSGKVYGIDISEGMLSKCMSRVRKAGFAERVFLKWGNASQLPFEKNFFDGIFMSFTLELFDTPEIPAVLSECRRTLRPGGRTCIVAMSRAGRLSLMTRIYEWLHKKLPAYFDCRPVYVQASMEGAGLRTLEVKELSLLGLGVEIVLSEKT
jgi:demethylmenaquinone methyltransferase/2-methoxy-6-polyprenyl-1,4-benzoquinol methylase